ncbi:MAG: hypothetical protein K2W82_13330 [Candidatus Obscuribacterales bacterium]|nr:hypothetical protein [Candidatus Obscuribacterales bacterium]
MNSSKHQSIEKDLSLALDRSVEAAVALEISEISLVSKLLQHLHAKVEEKSPCSDKKHSQYNPEAGP